MISADEWERRALSLQAEIEKSLGNLHLTKSDVEDDDFLLLETLNSKPGKYLIDDLSLSDLDDLDIELIGDIDIGEDTEAEKPLKVWPIGYSSLCLKLKRLDALSATPTSYWLEIIVPGLEPIRSRITIPKARSSVSKSIPINLNIVQTISLDIPVESTINFKLFAIAAPSGIPTRTARSSQVSQELWTGFGTLYVKDLLHCPE